MKYTTKTLEDKRIEITISLDKEEWEQAVQAAYDKNKGKYNIQGFRKGHVPRKVLEKNFGEGVFYEDAIDGCFYRYYFEVLQKEKSVEPIDAPALSIKNIDENGLVIVATVQNKPEVKLGDYKGLTVKKDTVKITDKDVDAELDKMVASRARFIEVSDRAVENGDMATIDFCGTIDGVKFDGGEAKDYDLEIGSHSFIDTFEDQLIGLNVGDKKDVNVTFPSNYHVESLKDKPAVFAVEIKGIKTKQLPELNDEFASEVSEFENLADLKKDIKEKLTHSAEHEAEHKQEADLIDAVVANATVEVPEIMVEHQVEDFIRDFEYRLSYQGLKLEDYLNYLGQSLEDLKASRKEDAEKTVKTRLVIEAIIKAENITVTDADIEAKYNEGREKAKTIDEIKKELKDEQIAYLENGLLINKVIALLKENNNL
jgi:trigger factor